MKNSTLMLIPALISLTGLSGLQAEVIMFNFSGGSTPSDANLTNSPYHSDNPSFTDTTWNNVSNADESAGSLSFADGTTASGVALNLGVADLTISSTVDLSDNPSSANNLGTKVSTGIFAGDSVGTGGVYDGSGADRRVIGAQITGLPAGTYDVYIQGINTNVAYNEAGISLPFEFAAGAGTAGADFDFTGYNSATVTYETNQVNASSWLEAGNGLASNYGKIRVTLAAGQALNLVSNGDGGKSNTGDSNRGFLNSAQIVTIPEPGSLILLGLGALAVMIVRRRH